MHHPRHMNKVTLFSTPGITPKTSIFVIWHLVRAGAAGVSPNLALDSLASTYTPNLGSILGTLRSKMDSVRAIGLIESNKSTGGRDLHLGTLLEGVLDISLAKLNSRRTNHSKIG